MCQRASSPDTQAMKRYLTVGYGAAAYVAVPGRILVCWLAFVGDIVVPRSVDHGIASPIGQAVVVNVVLLGAVRRPAQRDGAAGVQAVVDAIRAALD